MGKFRGSVQNSTFRGKLLYLEISKSKSAMQSIKNRIGENECTKCAEHDTSKTSFTCNTQQNRHQPNCLLIVKIFASASGKGTGWSNKVNW